MVAELVVAVAVEVYEPYDRLGFAYLGADRCPEGVAAVMVVDAGWVASESESDHS